MSGLLRGKFRLQLTYRSTPFKGRCTLNPKPYLAQPETLNLREREGYLNIS